MPTELGGVSSFILVDPTPQLLELIDAGVDSLSRRAQMDGQVRTDRLIRSPQVYVCDLFDFRHCQPKRSKTTDHPDAPEGGLVKQTVVSRAPADRIDEAQPLVLTKRLDRHACAAGQFANRHLHVSVCPVAGMRVRVLAGGVCSLDRLPVPYHTQSGRNRGHCRQRPIKDAVEAVQGEPVDDLLASAFGLHESAMPKTSEMGGDARLRLLDCGNQFADRALTVLKELEDPKPGRIAQHPEEASRRGSIGRS